MRGKTSLRGERPLVLFTVIGKNQITRGKTIGIIHTVWEGPECEGKDQLVRGKTISGGKRPLVFFTVRGKDHIRREKTTGIFYCQRERPDHDGKDH
jgi:hypothetical protein